MKLLRADILLFSKVSLSLLGFCQRSFPPPDVGKRAKEKREYEGGRILSRLYIYSGLYRFNVWPFTLRAKEKRCYFCWVHCFIPNTSTYKLWKQKVTCFINR